MIEIELSYPPTVNHYKKVGSLIMTKNGKYYQQRVDTKKTKLFYYEVWLAIKNLKAIKRIPMPIESNISLEVYLYPPDKRKRDIDNCCKPLIDSLVKAGLIKDDVQISRLVVERKGIIAQGKVVIRIQEIL